MDAPELRCPCGSAASVERHGREYRALCSSPGCWIGPGRQTPELAAEAWRRAMAAAVELEPLTPRQRAVLEHVREEYHRTRAGLTVAALARGLGCAPSTAHGLVATLRQKGRIAPSPGIVAGIVPLNRS